MPAPTRAIRTTHRRRAIIAIQVGIVLTVMLGAAALTVDVGQLYTARAQLQRAADSAALAGASAYASDAMMRVRMATGGADSLSQVKGLAETRADQFSNLNNTLGSPTQVAGDAITTGWINVFSNSEPIQTNPAANDYNAVRVVVTRSAGTAEGSNGPVPLFFAPIFGKITAEASASAVAIFDDRVSGFETSVPGAGMLPFTIHEDAFASELAFGGDQYAYDGTSNVVSKASDGIREIRLYPYPLSGSGYSAGDGNFGVLNIGTGHQGVEAERVQILNGVSPADFEAEIGTSDLTFADDAGDPVKYDMTGSPGLEATLSDAINQIKGHVVGFFLHDNVILSGSNAIYTITAVRFGRVMDCRLTGPPNQRGLFLQPVSYAGGGVKIDTDAPPTGGLVGLVILAR
jgi:Flp pilus assembly protein TadG